MLSKKFAWHLKTNPKLSIMLYHLKLHFKGQGKALAQLKSSDTSTWMQTEKHSSIHLSRRGARWAGVHQSIAGVGKQFKAKTNLEKTTQKLQ